MFQFQPKRSDDAENENNIPKTWAEAKQQAQQGNSQSYVPTTWAEAKANPYPYAEQARKASGIELMQRDVFQLLEDGASYFQGNDRSVGGTFKNRVTAMRQAIAKEQQYFKDNASFFDPTELAGYQEALSVWDTELSNYESAMTSGGNAYAWLNQKDSAFEQAFSAEGTKAGSKEAASLAVGMPQLGTLLESVRTNAEQWTQPEFRPTAQQRTQYLETLKKAKSTLEYAKYYFGANSAYFSQEEKNAYEQYFAQAEGFLDYAQAYYDGGVVENPFTGKAMPTMPMESTDMNDDDAADTMYPGGQFGLWQDGRRAQENTQRVQQWIEAVEKTPEYIFGNIFRDMQNDKDKDAVISQGQQRHQEAWDGYEDYLSNDRRYLIAIALGNDGSNDAANAVRTEARHQYPLAVMVEALPEEDQATFFYLLGKEQDDLALQFANECMKQERINTQALIRQWAGRNIGTQALATVGSIALLPFSWSDPILAEKSTALTGLKTYGGVGFGNIKDNLRAGVSEEWNEAIGTLPKEVPVVGGKGFGDLYQLGMSGVDSYVSGLVFGSGAASTLLGSSAMASAYNDALDKGVSPEVALQQGLSQGLAEALFEKVSLGFFFDGKISGGMIKQILAQGGIEASEELCTSVANHFTDRLIMGDLSEYELAIAQYEKEGKTREEAEKLARWDFYESLAQDALGGFLIGGTMAGIQTASNHQAAKKNASVFAELLVNNTVTEEYAKYAQLAGVTEQDSTDDARKKFEAWAMKQYRDGSEENYVATVFNEQKNRQINVLIDGADGSFGEVSAAEFTPDTLQTEQTQTITDDVQAEQNNLQRQETVQEQFDLQHSEQAPSEQFEQKNMTAEPSENLGGIENAEVFDDSSQWDEGLGTGGQDGSVAEGTSGSVSRGQARTQAAILSDLRKNAAAQSARAIGVRGGSENNSLYVLSNEDIAQSEQWQKIKDDAEADGARVVMFAGDLQVYNPSTKRFARVEGIHQTDEYGNTTYYIKADKLSRSAQQIYMHEKIHEIVSANPGLLGDLVRALEAQYGKQEIAALVNSYIEAYDGIYGRFDESMTADEQENLIMQYMNEIFADVYAGIRRGRANLTRAKQVMDSQTTELQRAAQNRKAMQNKNAPPQQRYSIETTKDGYKFVRADRQVIYGNDPDSWGEQVENYIDRKIRSYEDVVLTAEDGDLLVLTKDTVGKSSFRNYITEGGRTRPMTDSEYETKLNAEVHIDELATISTRGSKNEPDEDGRHGEMAEYGWNYRTAYFMDFDGKYYRLKISVAMGRNGKVVYNVANIRERSFLTNSGSSAKSGAQSEKTSFVDRVSQSEPSVKQEFSFDEDAGQLDQEYLSAVESGDMETAQRMVDEAARRVGYTNSEDWRMNHRAPTSKDDTARSMDQIDEVYGGDGSIYSPRAMSYYGEGYDYDYKVFSVIRSARNNPDKMITVYRAIPTEIQDTRVRNGDWVAIAKEYAQDHGERMFDENFRIIENRVPAKHLYCNGDSVNEWGYDNGNQSEVYKNAVGNVKLAAVTYDDNGNVIPLSERFDESKTDIRYSFDDDVAELDEGYARHMAEDDTPEGLAPDDDKIDDYHAIAKAEKERRAGNATANQLKNHIKSSEKAIAAHREAKTALKNIGGLTKESAEQLDKKIKLIRETLQIDRAALKEKQAAEEKHRKKERKEKEQAEIQEQKAKTAQKELRQDLLNLFSVKPGVRMEVAQVIDMFSDELIRSGSLTNEHRRALFETLYEYGEEFIEADEYFSDIRKELQQGRIYVSESVRAEFGDDWKSFRDRAWGNRIYLTSNQNDMGIDVWTDMLYGAYGGQFDAENDLKTQLETIIELAEEGKGENVTIAEMMRRNQDDYGWSVEEQMDELERKVDRMLETFAQKADLEIRLRQESVRKIMNDHAYFRKKMEDNRTVRMENTARNQVMRGIEKLSKMRRKASPEYRKQIDEVLKDIDTVARSISARGLEDLQELSRLYLEQKEAQGDNFLSSPYVEARLGRLQKTQLDDMSIDDVRELGRMVSSIANAIQNSNKLLADKKKKLIETVAENVDQEVTKAKGSKGGALRTYLLNHMDAKRVFGQLSGWADGAFEALGENLSKGQERSMHYQLNAMRIFDDFLAKKENQKWVKQAAGKDAQWIKIEVPYRVEVSEGVFEMKTKQIEITPMMRISLLMHSMNDDNLRHIKGGGIRIPDKALYKKGKMKEALVRGEIVKMEPATVKAIVKECTEQERTFAKLLEKYFNGLSKDSINEVSMLLDGFERAGGEHYFHIKTDPAFLAKQNDAVKRDLSVQALGSVVNERLHASNPIVLEDATAALMEHIENISKYYGFAVPLRDLNAVLSHTFHQKDNAFSGSVMNTIQEKWGSSAEEYIDKLMADLQSPERNGDMISNFAAKLRGNYARAVIAANLSSLMKQTTSYPVALPYLKVGGLLHGLKKLGKDELNTLEKYSAVYWYRNLGNSTMELSDALKRKDFGDSLPWLFNATQKMDSFTTRRLLAACEYRVQHDMKLRPGTQEEIDAGTDRYWTEVAKLFNDVVLKTQSNSTTMERPQITRANAGNLSRFFTMFRTDAFQQYNMLVEAYGRLGAAKRAFDNDGSAQNKKALSEAKKFTARTMTGILTGQMGCVLVTMLLKTARFDDDEFRDEEGDLDIGKLALYFGSGVVEGFSGFLVGAEIIYAAAEVAINKMVDGDARWWDIEPTGLSTINDSLDALINLADTLADGNLWEGREKVRKAALAIFKGFGLPVENAEKYLLMAARWVAPEWVEKYQNFWTEITKSNLSKESMRTIADAIGVLMDNRTQDMSDDAKEEIARLYVAGGVGAVPTGIPTSVSYSAENGDEVTVELKEKQREQYRKVWSEIVSGTIGELLASDEYEQADDEGKTELLDKLYKYANQVAQNAVVPEKELAKWVQQGVNAVDDGIPLEEYICFRIALGDIDGKNASGETVDGLKAQRNMVLLESMGWSDEQEKNVYLDVLASESKAENTKALMAAGLSWDQTNDIVSILGNKKWEHMNAIIRTNASEKVKAKALEVYASDNEKLLIRTGVRFGVKLEWYAEVRNKADTDGNGSISQEEATKYIGSMGLSWQDSAYLWQMVTDGKEGKNNPFSQDFGEEFWYEAHKDD